MGLNKNFPKIISFTGPMGSGKSTALTILQTLLRQETGTHTELIKFADPLYRMQDSIYYAADLPLEQGQKDRKLLQWLGTEWGRGIDEDIWVNIFKKDVTERHDGVILLNDDCRFDNEAAAIREMNGIVVKMLGGSRIEDNGIANHASESGVSEKYIDFYIRNHLDDVYLAENISKLVEILKLRG